MRAGLPPLSEGDEYAITDIETAPMAGGDRKAQSSGVYASKEADLNAVLPPRGILADDGISVLDIKLPDNILAILEQSAQKLNSGLGGKTEGR